MRMPMDHASALAHSEVGLRRMSGITPAVDGDDAAVYLVVRVFSIFGAVRNVDATFFGFASD